MGFVPAMQSSKKDQFRTNHKRFFVPARTQKKGVQKGVQPWHVSKGESLLKTPSKTKREVPVRTRVTGQIAR
jgi:hypothetical protein